MRTGTGDLVAEYTYNGLGYRIGWHYDADVDGDVDGSDPWYRFVYDERWRIVATYRGSDSDPKEQFVHHAAGDSGYGTASYIDDVILRDRDDNSGWTSSADGTLEERVFHCQNWRHDVVALVDGNGDQVEMARYSPYGVPFGLPAGDLDSDGDVDAADLTVFDALVAYDVRADLDLDGDYDASDRSTINANRGTSAGLGVLSQSAVASRKGYAGLPLEVGSILRARARVLAVGIGRFLSRGIGVQAFGRSSYHFPASNVAIGLSPHLSLPCSPQGSAQGGGCSPEAIQHALSDVRVQWLLQQIVSCGVDPIPPIECCGSAGCCNNPGMNGCGESTYSPRTRTVTINRVCICDTNTAPIVDVLIHELTRVLQACMFTKGTWYRKLKNNSWDILICFESGVLCCDEPELCDPLSPPSFNERRGEFCSRLCNERVIGGPFAECLATCWTNYLACAWCPGAPLPAPFGNMLPPDLLP